jgi:hypothetical protein
MSLKRPAAIEDGRYWIGKFDITTKGDRISIMTRQFFSHNHQYIDELQLKKMGSNWCTLKIVAQRDSKKAERRIKKLLASKVWKSETIHLIKGR